MILENNPELELELYMVEKLGWKSRKTMREEMSNSEFELWVTYYGRKAQRAELAAKGG